MNSHALILTAITLSLVGALVSALSAYLAPQFPVIWQVALAITGLSFACYLYLDRKSMGQLFSKKTTRYGLNVLVMSVVALGIAIFVNLIANEHDLKRDFTKNKVHSLSEQTLKILKSLKNEVTIRAFIDPSNKPAFQDVLGRYTYQSKLVKVDFLDVDKDPRLLDRLKIKGGNSLIVESASREARIDNLMGPDDPKVEEKITNAIIQVAKGEKKKVYFTSGHGEYLPSGGGRESMSQFKDALESSRFSVQEIVLLTAESIPKDADLVIVAGPRTDFTDREIKLLEDWTLNGGKLLFMVTPMSPAKLKSFIASMGGSWNPKKTVFETNVLAQMASGSPVVPLVSSYDSTSEITRDLKQPSLFRMPSPIEKTATPPTGLKVTSLFSTSAQSFEVQVEVQGDKAKVEQKGDRRGPLSLAISVSGAARKSASSAVTPQSNDKAFDGEPAKVDNEFRVVIVGNADFASNGFLGFGSNSDLAQNMVAWLSHDEDLISIRPRPSDDKQLDISEAQARIVMVSTLISIPLLLFVSGLAVWFTRKRK